MRMLRLQPGAFSLGAGWQHRQKGQSSMASLVHVQIVEQQTLDVAELRARMNRAGVSVREMARTAGMYHGNLSALMNGREYLGPKSQARLIAAAHELGLDAEETS
jgi:hypothetical protein